VLQLKDELFFLKYVSGFTLKPMSDTRWESLFESIKPLRFQLCQVHDALVEVSELTKNPKIKSESLSFANYEFSYDYNSSDNHCQLPEV